MRLLRELSRRKLRTTLTVIGITIGIWALVVFGALANQINGLVSSGSEFFADKILVTDGESLSTSPIRIAAADVIAGLDGVAAVDTQIEIVWDPEAAVGFSAPDRLTAGVDGNRSFTAGATNARCSSSICAPVPSGSRAPDASSP